MRQKYVVYPFGQSGDQTAIPDPTQPGGTVSFQQGWPFNYQRQLGVDPLALPIDRATMNYLFNAITAQIQQYQQFGIPEWITSANNGGTPFAYDFGAMVRYSATGNPPFTTYVSTLAGTATNTDTPGATANWQLVTLSTKQIQAMIEAQAGNYYLDTGTANAYVITMNPPVTAYANGMPFSFRVSHANTGASTIDMGPGPIDLRTDVGGVLANGDLPVNSVVSGFYDQPSGKALISTLVTSQVLSQAAGDIRYAKLAGLSSQNFAAASFVSKAPGSSYTSANLILQDSSGANDLGVVNVGGALYFGGGITDRMVLSVTGLSLTGKNSQSGTAATAGDLVTYQQTMGLGQTWQLVTRNSGTTYTNTTGAGLPIAVNSTITVPGNTTITVNGVTFDLVAVCAPNSTFGKATGFIIVPAGATYVFTDTGSNTRTTYELR